jgi:hypothetical protein
VDALVAFMVDVDVDVDVDAVDGVDVVVAFEHAETKAATNKKLDPNHRIFFFIYFFSFIFSFIFSILFFTFILLSHYTYLLLIWAVKPIK